MHFSHTDKFASVFCNFYFFFQKTTKIISLRESIDLECGGANLLLRLGQIIVHGLAHKDEGISGRPMPFAVKSSRSHQSNFAQADQDQLVNEFLGQMSAPPPQSFRMDALSQSHPVELVQDEVRNGLSWVNEFRQYKADAVSNLKALQPQQMQQTMQSTLRSRMNG